MTDEEIEAVLGPGHCTRAAAFEKGCFLCKPKFEAIDRLKKEHAHLGDRIFDLERQLEKAEERIAAMVDWASDG